jgi:hypothetical protein
MRKETQYDQRANKKFKGNIAQLISHIHYNANVNKGTAFVIQRGMDNEEAGTRGQPKKFQVAVGENIADVEIISLQNKICAVEIPGREAIFITRIKDRNNKPYWVSIPQGNNEVASIIGDYIDQQIYSRGK